MFSRASCLFSACLLASFIVNCQCTTKLKHNHAQENSEKFSLEENDSKFYVQQLFNKYGDNGNLTLKGLEHMFQSLGLYSSLGLNFSLCHNCVRGISSYGNGDNAFSSNYDKESSKPIFIARKNITQKVHSNQINGISNSGLVKEDNTELDCNSSNCDIDSSNVITTDVKNWGFKPEEMLLKLNVTSSEDIITHSAFFYLCPAIVYQIDLISRMEVPLHHDDDHNHHDHLGSQVWLYATISVVTISLCGLLSVAIVPLIQRVCYQMVLQFLVGLAVGSLSGDALMHLFPHAFTVIANGHREEEHSSIFIWRGFTALFGIYLFYFAEQFLNLATSYRKMKQNSKVIQTPKFSRALTRMGGEQSKVVGEKLSHHKHGSYGYKFDPALNESLDGIHETMLSEKKLDSSQISEKNEDETESQKEKLDANAELDQITSDGQNESNLSEWDKSSVKCVDQNGDPSSPLKPLHVDVTYLPSLKQSEPETPTEECHRETVVYSDTHDDHSYVVTVTEHHHGHSHEVPKTISAVAWMVVMGDGLHNFCDGLAIGAAFAATISGGISTAIAVFCHELPHELGDFAMLLKTGMTVKQALLYNSISSLLCFFGMVIGVSLGNIISVSYWIFSGAGGMFLYIALVDMIPELATVNGHTSGNMLKQIFIQFCGMSTGTTIMFLIAIYEHDLQHLFS